MRDTSPLGIITGASSGIGQATARALAQQGYRTVLIARRADRLEALAEELSKQAPSTALPLDLLDTEAIPAVLQKVLQAHGPCDVLVNNAGVGYLAPLAEQMLEDHERMFRLHYLAAVATIQVVLPSMRTQRRGHVFNVCSIATRVSPWGHGSYTAAKSALDKLTHTLYAEHAHEGLRFTSVHPGVIRTPFFDDPSYAPVSGRILKHGIPPQRVARRIVTTIGRRKLTMHVPWHLGLLQWMGAACPGAVHGWAARMMIPPDQQQ